MRFKRAQLQQTKFPHLFNQKTQLFLQIDSPAIYSVPAIQCLQRASLNIFLIIVSTLDEFSQTFPIIIKTQMAANSESSRAQLKWFQKTFERFPFTLFSGIQSFIFYQNFTDFLGGIVEFPLALIQAPFYLMAEQKTSFPNRNSEIQALINLGRFRSFHSDVI